MIGLRMNTNLLESAIAGEDISEADVTERWRPVIWLRMIKYLLESAIAGEDVSEPDVHCTVTGRGIRIGNLIFCSFSLSLFCSSLFHYCPSFNPNRSGMPANSKGGACCILKSTAWARFISGFLPFSPWKQSYFEVLIKLKRMAIQIVTHTRVLKKILTSGIMV